MHFFLAQFVQFGRFTRKLRKIAKYIRQEKRWRQSIPTPRSSENWRSSLFSLTVENWKGFTPVHPLEKKSSLIVNIALFNYKKSHICSRISVVTKNSETHNGICCSEATNQHGLGTLYNLFGKQWIWIISINVFLFKKLLQIRPLSRVLSGFSEVSRRYFLLILSYFDMLYWLIIIYCYLDKNFLKKTA